MSGFFNSVLSGKDYASEENLFIQNSFVSSLGGQYRSDNETLFTYSNGCIAVGAGSMSHNVKHITESYLDRCRTEIEVVVNDVNSKFAVLKEGEQRGNIATVDLSSSTMYLGIIATQNVEPSYEFSQAMSVVITSGQTYKLELVKDRQVIKVRFYNVASPLIVDELIRDYDVNNTYAGSNWGKPSFSFFSGSVVFKNIKYYALAPLTPYVAMYGDSITEGRLCVPLFRNLKGRWADKVWVANNGNAYISAKAAIVTFSLVAFMNYDFTYLSPKYVIIAIGSNDNVFSTFQTNLNTVLGIVNAKGAIPVLCTIPPRADRQAYINEANTELLNVYGQTYDIIDRAKALTVGGDRTTWVAEYVLPDGIHPTAEGMQAIYDDIKINHSYLI